MLSAFMTPVGVDGMAIDLDTESLNDGKDAPVKREHSLSIDSEFARQGDIQSASLGLKLAQQSVLNRQVLCPNVCGVALKRIFFLYFL